MSNSSRQAVVFVAIGAILISLSAPFVKAAAVSPSTSGFYRMAFGAVGLAVLLLVVPAWRKQLRQGWLRGWSGSLLIALCFTFDLWFWHRSIHWIGPGLSTLLANFQVFLMTFAGVALFAERPGWRFFSGLVLAVFGLWLLLVQQWPDFNAQQRLGVWFAFLTAISYSAYMLTLRHSQTGQRALNVVVRLFQVSLCTAVMLAAVNIVEGQSFGIPDQRSLLLLIAYGLLCQVGGWLLITRGLPGIAAGLAGLLLLLQPSLSVAWDMLFFELTLNGWQWFGLVLALAGIYFGSLRGLR